MLIQEYVYQLEIAYNKIEKVFGFELLKIGLDRIQQEFIIHVRFRKEHFLLLDLLDRYLDHILNLSILI